MTLRSRWLKLTVATMSLWLCEAAAAASPGMRVLDAWSRATAPGMSVGVVYFDIVNDGPADELIGLECPAARRAEMHSTASSGGIMRMRALANVEVPAHGRVAFAPNGLHVMLVDLTQPLQTGTRLTLTLIFERAGKVNAEVSVR